MYTREYHRFLGDSARDSANIVVPMLLELVTPRSVIDVGCGNGVWLAAFAEHGVADIWGVDGFVEEELLEIPRERFIRADLQQALTLGRTFDLAVSLEVAEHLPEDCGQQFIESLTSLSPIVLFSAAIPSQGGVQHVNEQWQDYWAGFFQARDFEPVDCIRRRIWQNEDVEWWYAQNILLYVRRDVLAQSAALRREHEMMGTGQLSLVHPKKYLYLLEWAKENCAIDNG